MSREIQVKIDSAKNDSYIKKAIHAALGKILNHCEKKYDARYSDQTMLILYNMAEQFSKQVEDVVCAENMNPETDIFGTTANYNYFEQQRQF